MEPDTDVIHVPISGAGGTFSITWPSGGSPIALQPSGLVLASGDLQISGMARPVRREARCSVWADHDTLVKTLVAGGVEGGAALTVVPRLVEMRDRLIGLAVHLGRIPEGITVSIQTKEESLEVLDLDEGQMVVCSGFSWSNPDLVPLLNVTGGHGAFELFGNFDDATISEWLPLATESVQPNDKRWVALMMAHPKREWRLAGMKLACTLKSAGSPAPGE